MHDARDVGRDRLVAEQLPDRALAALDARDDLVQVRDDRSDVLGDLLVAEEHRERALALPEIADEPGRLVERPVQLLHHREEPVVEFAVRQELAGRPAARGEVLRDLVEALERARRVLQGLG